MPPFHRLSGFILYEIIGILRKVFDFNEMVARRDNQVRPHEALGMQVPARHHQSSPRDYNPQPCEWEYEAGMAVKPLNSEGFLEYQQRRYFVGEALAEQPVVAQRIENKLLV